MSDKDTREAQKEFEEMAIREKIVGHLIGLEHNEEGYVAEALQLRWPWFSAGYDAGARSKQDRVSELERQLAHEKSRHCIGGDIFEAERNRLILNMQTELDYLQRELERQFRLILNMQTELDYLQRELERQLAHEKSRHCIGGDIFEAERNRLILNMQTELDYLQRAESAEQRAASLLEKNRMLQECLRQVMAIGGNFCMSPGCGDPSHIEARLIRDRATALLKPSEAMTGKEDTAANTTTLAPCGPEDKFGTGRVKLSGVQDYTDKAQIVRGES